MFDLLYGCFFRASYRDSAFWLGEQETPIVPAISAHSNKNAFKVTNGTLDNDKSEMRPLIGMYSRMIHQFLIHSLKKCYAFSCVIPGTYLGIFLQHKVVGDEKKCLIIAKLGEVLFC